MTRMPSVLVLCLLAGVTGCYSHPEPVEGERLTVAKVQGEIKVGMSSAAVVEVLGSPNIITTDDERREVWVWDKVSSDRVDTDNSSYASLIIIGVSSGQSSSSARQRTLTIIIKFDNDKKVRDFAYNYTQF